MIGTRSAEMHVYRVDAQGHFIWPSVGDVPCKSKVRQLPDPFWSSSGTPEEVTLA